VVLEARGCEYQADDVVFLTPIMITAENLDQAERIGEVE